MTQSDGRSRLAERLTALSVADDGLTRSLEAATAAMSRLPAGSIDQDPIAAIANAVTAIREPMPSGLNTTAGAGESNVPSEDRPTPTDTRASGAIQAAYVPLGQASAAAAALFTTGRLLFEGTACDVAVDRMKIYAQVTKALNGLLPHVVGYEFRDQGLVCRCVCPMCGIGACGCIWASLHNIDVAWGGPGFAEPDERGVVLRSPPRPGSELSRAEVHQWDRIISVDDKPIRTPGELQAALRKHAIGEDAQMRVSRAGGSRAITVHHVSDLP